MDVAGEVAVLQAPVEVGGAGDDVRPWRRGERQWAREWERYKARVGFGAGR